MLIMVEVERNINLHQRSYSALIKVLHAKSKRIRQVCDAARVY